MKSAAAVALLLSASCVTTTTNASYEPMHVTVCELGAHPARYDGKRVELTALVESDGIEHTTLTDDACHDTGVAPSRLSAELQQAIYSGRPGTIDKRIMASFGGVFHWYPKRIPVRVLTVERVSDVHVESKP
jgi:hypothetical protein